MTKHFYFYTTVILLKKTCQTDTSAENSVVSIFDAKATDQGIEDRDDKHSDQVDVVQFVCCRLGIFKRRSFFTYLLEIIYTCVFNVNSSNDHEKYSNYSLKMNHDYILINKTNWILCK